MAPIVAKASADGVAHVLSNLDADGKPVFRMSRAANYHWHTDKPYHPAPPMLTMLHAVELPPLRRQAATPNSPTRRSPMTRCRTQTKRRIAGLRVAFRPAFDPEPPGVDHPLVRTHPETGRKSLYLGNHATHIVGLSRRRKARRCLPSCSRTRHSGNSSIRHRWRLGDLVMWDNRCLLAPRSSSITRLTRYRRVMHRSVVRGTVPF